MKQKQKTRLILIAAILIFILALGLTVYPLVAEQYTTKHQSELEADYSAALAEAATTDLDAIREAARAYNEILASGTATDAYTDAALEAAAQDYGSLLDPLGSGVMGYVRVPKIDVELPILHGTTDETLDKGIGHMLGSSLPVGGESTHAVLTGHSGMASAKMFSDLEQMEIGDMFYLDILGETLAYEVDEINVVEPHDVTKITITPGEDYCTLLTCTPFGVNTHRLLVRGHRVEYVPEETVEAQEDVTTEDTTESVWDVQYKKGLLLGLFIALLLLAVAAIIYLVMYARQKRSGTTVAEKTAKKKGGKYEQGT